MNRRDFFGWLSRLLAVLPFVALADLEPEPELSLVSTNDLMKIWSQSPVETPIDFGLDGETIYSISLKDTLVLNGEYSREQIQDFWQRLRELNGHE